MFHWKENLLFKHRYLTQAHDFYEKHGAGAIIVARFIPIVRTFSPIVAGIVTMDKKKFAFYNVVGCVAWVFSMLFAGHFLQKWILSQFGFDLKIKPCQLLNGNAWRNITEMKILCHTH